MVCLTESARSSAGPIRAMPRPAQLLRDVLRAHDVRDSRLARWLGCTRRVASRYLGGERAWTLDRLGELPDPLVREFCERVLVSLDARSTRGVEGEHLDVVVQLGRVSEILREALSDGRLDDEEHARVFEASVVLAREVADLQRAAQRRGMVG